MTFNDFLSCSQSIHGSHCVQLAQAWWGVDAEVAAEVQSQDETFFGSDIDVDSKAESQPSSPAAIRLNVADDSRESEDEESSPAINSESGASDGSDVVSSAAEEEMEGEIAERLHAG